MHEIKVNRVCYAFRKRFKKRISIYACILDLSLLLCFPKKVQEEGFYMHVCLIFHCYDFWKGVKKRVAICMYA